MNSNPVPILTGITYFESQPLRIYLVREFGVDVSFNVSCSIRDEKNRVVNLYNVTIIGDCKASVRQDATKFGEAFIKGRRSL